MTFSVTKCLPTVIHGGSFPNMQGGKRGLTRGNGLKCRTFFGGSTWAQFVAFQALSRNLARVRRLSRGDYLVTDIAALPAAHGVSATPRPTSADSSPARGATLSGGDHGSKPAVVRAGRRADSPSGRGKALKGVASRGGQVHPPPPRSRTNAGNRARHPAMVFTGRDSFEVGT